MFIVSERATPLADRLRTLREAAGYTQQEVAEQIGVAAQTYWRWEQGRGEPSFRQICAVAAMFGKTPNDFVTDEEEPPSS